MANESNSAQPLILSGAPGSIWIQIDVNLNLTRAFLSSRVIDRVRELREQILRLIVCTDVRMGAYGTQHAMCCRARRPLARRINTTSPHSLHPPHVTTACVASHGICCSSQSDLQLHNFLVSTRACLVLSCCGECGQRGLGKEWVMVSRLRGGTLPCFSW